MVRVFDQEFGPAVRRLPQSAWGADTGDYLWAKAMAHRADPRRATIYWDSLATWAAARAAIDKDDPVYFVMHAMALAGTGQKAAALRELRALPATVARLDAMAAAEAYVLVGDYDGAIGMLETAGVGAPDAVAPSVLDADPIWDPLRQHPRFKKLLQPR
jgi:serine/threonine-protein kinase